MLRRDRHLDALTGLLRRHPVVGILGALDLLVVCGNRRLGFEFKRTSAPRLTKSMHTALRDLRLERLHLIHAGSDTFPLAKQVRAIALARLQADLAPLDDAG